MTQLDGSGKTAQFDQRPGYLARELSRLLAAPPTNYSTATPKVFPEVPGVYAIFDRDGAVVRAGKTDSSLQQRLYRNHLMGSQDGNLPMQLVNSGVCGTQGEAKNWIRKNCTVRWLEIENFRERGLLEHFILAVLEPKFCDKNKQDESRGCD
jgi:hypothetical protein